MTVDADGIGRYSQDVEAAVYFSVLEALQNVQKYAQASRARRCGCASATATSHFSVSDDGRGFDRRHHGKGSGLINMADRIDALGGTVRCRLGAGAGDRAARVASRLRGHASPPTRPRRAARG